MTEPTTIHQLDARKVFVVHGRDERLRRDFFAFLRSLGLAPIEWSQAVQMTGKGSPYIGEVLDMAFSAAQAVVVLLTPDDEVRLLPKLSTPADPLEEREYRLQPRPNVIFEAGTAFGRCPERTVLVEVGDLKRFSDVVGRHAVRLTNDAIKRHEVANRLKTAGCLVSTAGNDWLQEGDFSAVQPAGPVNQPKNQQPSKATAQSTIIPRCSAKKIGRDHRFKIWLELTPKEKRLIREVRYTFNHKSFGEDNIKTSKNPKNGFMVSYVGYGAISSVSIRVQYSDGSARTKNFNMLKALGW